MSLRARGYSLIEMMVSLAVILVIMAGIFQMLGESQQRYVATSSIQDSTAMIRDSMDQMIREIRLSGYPPAGGYPCPPPVGAAYGTCLTETNSGFIAGGILMASDYAVQFEGDTDGNGLVEVFDYELQIPTAWAGAGCGGLTENANLTAPALMRSAVEKAPDGTVPAVSFQPFLENVRNCDLGIAIFVNCPAPPAAAPAVCPSMTNYDASSLPAPRNTRIVLIDLQVRMAVRDPQTGAFPNVEQFGIAERVNPDR